MTERKAARGAGHGGGETLKPAFLGVIMNLVRTSRLGAAVDVSEVVAFISAQWAEFYRDGAVDLTPLFDHLRARPGVQFDDLAGILLHLHRREERLGLQFLLPADVERLAQPVRERLLRDALSVGVQSGLTLTGMPRTQAELPPPGRGGTSSGTLAALSRPSPPETANTPSPPGPHPVAGLRDKVRKILKPE